VKPLRVAVTGGIGAGKTEALRAFARRGVPTLSADEVVHRLIGEDPEVRAALQERFGTTDRAGIAAVVFSAPAELRWLEGLLHPRVEEAERAWAAGLDAPVAASEIPLLYEVGADARFDVVVVITASPEVRAGRTPLSVDARAARLIPDDEKTARAGFAYVNDGTLEELDAFVGGVLEELLRRCAS
jgi:dephospho-CoA kinase